MTERLRRLTEAELDDAQREVYRSIAGGPRASVRQLFDLKDAAGALNGPFGLMLHVPRLGAPLQELGSAIRYSTSLSDRAREIAILKVAAATESSFEWYAHERVGAAVGLTPDELEALRQSRFSSVDRIEEAVSRLCDVLLADGRLTDDEYDGLVEALGEEQMLETAVLVGYYLTLARMMAAFCVEAPAPSVVEAG
ncbi:carboxymuconolactone decarboxylase family protein [Streptomyces sp. NPDC057611]|uniref:carboxymuconolactone decarboxylase family protein n=1 Tax=Streptomyces sp. NPDC057611 TaxID=3346182 RepID=UPI0036775A80